MHPADVEQIDKGQTRTDRDLAGGETLADAFDIVETHLDKTPRSTAAKIEEERRQDQHDGQNWGKAVRKPGQKLDISVFEKVEQPQDSGRYDQSGSQLV